LQLQLIFKREQKSGQFLTAQLFFASPHNQLKKVEKIMTSVTTGKNVRHAKRQKNG